MRVWIDTDIGSDVDDALALAYVLRHPQLELVGVSCVFGDVGLRARIARDLLERADADPVPVLEGLGAPLTTGRPGLMFGHEGRGLLRDPAPRLRTLETPDASARVDALARAIAQARPDALLAIGPLTNLGALARAGIALPPLAIMGGKFEDVMLEGMVPQISEWNWFCDPVAVQAVVGGAHAALPLVVPAEVTFRTELERGDVPRLALGDRLARALAALCDEWLRAQSEILGSARPRVALHDPLAAALLAEPGLCPFEPRRVGVDDAGTPQPQPGAPNLRVAVDVDPEGLREHLLEVWLGAPDRAERST